MTEKITPSHLDRRAVVYLRQSTMKQTVDHQESTIRQYALRDRAIALGWPESRVDIIDSDLGHSGSSTDGRLGFQRLGEEVAHGRVGAIFSLEVSRLARSEADWHRLLDICGFADVVIVDDQSVYAPKDHNDRLLLGLKGTMSEAELVWMRLRLQGGALSKARRGELRIPAPCGYEWDATSCRLVLSPLEQVQRAVRLIFERFRVDGSATAVARYFIRNGLQAPTSSRGTGEVRWVAPSQCLILHMLRNPLYTGAYVFGRGESRRKLIDGEVKKHRTHILPQESWKVLLKGRHPGYIDWDEFMANQTKLDSNRANHRNPRQRGAPREGSALLQGLLLCGRCGHRMRTYYKSGPGLVAYYTCELARLKYGDSKTCWAVRAKSLDQAIVDLFLRSAQPDELSLTLAVANEAERQTQEIAAQWNLRLERAHYEVRHAERRYKAVDPENRAVARTLEKDWNDKLTHLAELERDKARAEQELHLTLTDEDRKRIRELARNLPLVWSLPSTTLAEQKNLLRLAIQDITATPIEVPDHATQLKVLWHSGATEEIVLDRAVGARTGSPRSTPKVKALLDKISAFMASGLNDIQIAETLNHQGATTTSGNRWTTKAIEHFRARHSLRRRSTTGSSGDSTTGAGTSIPRGKA